MSLSGHYWTLRQFFRNFGAPSVGHARQRWTHAARDEQGRDVELSGTLLCGASSDELLVVLHGLGGSIESRYMRRACCAAHRASLDCLLLNARGAGDSAGGVAHAGLSADLALALKSPRLADYRRIYLLGYSIGGHIALRYASLAPNPRVCAVVAICSPLDLAESVRAFDAPALSVYRHHVLSGLVGSYRRWARQGQVPVPLSELSGVRRIRQWDERVIVPAHGFSSASEYYETCSAGRILADLEVPALYVGARLDPMVPQSSVAPALANAPSRLQVHWSALGGHLAFPDDLSLGVPGALGLEAQCLGWLRRQSAGS